MNKENEQSTLVNAAKTIGSVAGKVASLVGGGASEGAPAPVEPAKKSKAGKLPAKNKQRLPRKQKKLAKKTALAKKA